MIEVKNLKKKFGEKTAVDGISFSIEKGKITGLLGPNGAGKTTTMRIMAGYFSDTEGAVSYDGLDLNKNFIAIKRRLGYLSEHAPLYTEMNVREYLHFCADARDLPERIKRIAIQKMLDLCELKTVIHVPIQQLSKGFKQRVALAGTLVHDPDYIILDEPSSGLDPNQIHMIRNLIRDLGKNKTILISTHILQEVTEICEKVIILSEGKIVMDADVNDLGVTDRIFFRSDIPIQKVKEIFFGTGMKDAEILQSNEDGTFNYSIDSLGQGGKSVFNILAKHSFSAHEIRPFIRSIDDIFSDLTRSK
jgi:ABC-2 type transport system ATP-binding protein